MAATEFGTNDAPSVKLWSTKLARQAIGQTYSHRFMGDGPDAIIGMKRELEASRGDEIRYDLLMSMTGPGVDGDTRLKGFEEPLVYHQDTVTIDQKRQAHLFRTMSQQRTVHDLRQDGQRNISQWYAKKFDQYAWAYGAGTAGQGTENVTAELPFAGNALQSPDADHEYEPSAVFSLNHIDFLKERAKTIDPLIRPAMVDGEPKYVLLCHPYTIAEMRTKTGDNEWKLIAARAESRGPRNPLYSGALGEYSGVIIHESEYIPYVPAAVLDAQSGKTGPKVFNLFMGAQSLCMAFGNAYGKLHRQTMGKGMYFSWFEDIDDYGNETGVAGGTVFGIKKTRFNSKDFGLIRYTTDDAVHT